MVTAAPLRMVLAGRCYTLIPTAVGKNETHTLAEPARGGELVGINGLFSVACGVYLGPKSTYPLRDSSVPRSLALSLLLLLCFLLYLRFCLIPFLRFARGLLGSATARHNSPSFTSLPRHVPCWTRACKKTEYIAQGNRIVNRNVVRGSG
jgi:hypothetical protein